MACVLCNLGKNDEEKTRYHFSHGNEVNKFNVTGFVT